MTTIKLSEVVNPWPRQKEFLNATRDHEYTLFGGAAGPGKSYILRWWLVDLLLKWAAAGHVGVRVGLFCEDYPALRDRHLSKVRTDFPAWLGRLNETQHEFRLHPHYGGGVLAFRNLDRPEKYQSVEFAAIAVDELTQNQRETFDVLRARKRWPGITFSPFAAATNPGGIGHVWVKQLWVDRDFSGDDSRLDPSSFAFVPARAGDNPALPESYISTLNTLPEKLRKAFLLGDWNIFVGQFFDEWDSSLHVVKPFAIPKEWPRWCGIDYGNAAPMCCLWLARAPDRTIYVYRELYVTRYTDVQQARAILELSKGERILWRYADPSMWSREPNGVSIAQAYTDQLCEIVQANNDRRAGWLRLRELLKVDATTKKPRLQVFETCPNLIRTLPGLVHDRIDVEDVDTDGEDHAPDALRYGGMAEAQAPQPPTKVRFG
ncbi:MAG: hypothetical protein JWQ89_3330 [Devosia sp.]|uniref:hypothetical protein n=1 Tax=Devosia sp. TaxID=1871048 RepID=UPI002618E9A8|nr:hypothetical protein [Devosia sp.]MDB5541603.1 hypothetical protein [Devosia sp.]